MFVQFINVHKATVKEQRVCLLLFTVHLAEAVKGFDMVKVKEVDMFCRFMKCAVSSFTSQLSADSVRVCVLHSHPAIYSDGVNKFDHFSHMQVKLLSLCGFL